MNKKLHPEDAAWIGRKVVEMADRIRPIAKVIVGTNAVWKLELDGMWFDVTVSAGAPGRIPG